MVELLTLCFLFIFVTNVEVQRVGALTLSSWTVELLSDSSSEEDKVAFTMASLSELGRVSRVLRVVGGCRSSMSMHG